MFHGYCMKIAQKLHGNCTEIAQKLHRNCILYLSKNPNICFVNPDFFLEQKLCEQKIGLPFFPFKI